MVVITWEDLKPLPSKVEFDPEANAITITVEIARNATEPAADVPRPAVLPHLDRKVASADHG
jgi:hypothetical protein